MSSICEIVATPFPDPLGLHINMMPFVMGDIKSIPGHMCQYESLIEACDLEREQFGKVGYLSIDESLVATGKTQRRPGIHTDGWNDSGWGGGGWGHGSNRGARKDGIYLASTAMLTCRAWDIQIVDPGPLGDCESRREELSRSSARYMHGNTIYWITDRTPHESLPVERPTYRQWFRLVTHKVDVWYAKHSTANPLGVQPFCPITECNKFKVVQ